MPPVDSADAGVTENEVLSMFDKDGDLREEPQADDEESGDEGQGDEESQEEEETEPEEEEAEEEEDPEADEDEESDEEEEEPESKVDWSTAKPEHKAAHEADQKEIGKLRKDYGKLHSKYAELSQSRREEDQSLQELRAGHEMASQWNEILEQHPELEKQIMGLIQKAQNPDSEIPEHLKDDPAIQFMLQQNQRLQQQLRQVSDQTKPLKEWEQEKAAAQSKQKLDSLLDDAAKEFKSMFGKDMGEEERTAVLKYMVERKYYESGSNAALAVFAQQYKKALSAKDASRLRDKAKKFGSRNKTVNSRQATSAPKINSSNDAIRQALADQGLDV